MTLQQIRYCLTIAESGSMNRAAETLYVTQHALTGAIQELATELGITIFNRTNKGIFISREGEEFLGYARQVLEQTTILEDKYKKIQNRVDKMINVTLKDKRYQVSVDGYNDDLDLKSVKENDLEYGIIDYENEDSTNQPHTSRLKVFRYGNERCEYTYDN